MNIISKIQSLFHLFKQYPLFWLPLIPLVLFFILIIFLFIQPTKNTQQSQVIQPSPTSIVSIPLLTPVPSNAWSNDIGGEGDWETFPELEKKEKRTDGTIVYTYTSLKPDRPNITITNKNNNVIFYREQRTKELPLMNVPLVKETYGEPDQIIQGSTYYGPQAVIYFYESLNRAYIVNPETNETYEVQSFTPMSVDEYLQRYKALN